jgi:hypothetical protein
MLADSFVRKRGDGLPVVEEKKNADAASDDPALNEEREGFQRRHAHLLAKVILFLRIEDGVALCAVQSAGGFDRVRTAHLREVDRGRVFHDDLLGRRDAKLSR